MKHTHFGGFEDDDDADEDDEPARKKSKAEVMAEVIAKSKQHKVRRSSSLHILTLLNDCSTSDR